MRPSNDAVEETQAAWLRDELSRLLKEQIDSLEAQAFIPVTKESAQADEKRLKRIREVSAEFVALMQKHTAAKRGIQNGGAAMEQDEKATVTLPGTVEKVIGRRDEPNKAEIKVESADPLYQEIRVENELIDSKGKPVELKPGAQVEVKIEADENAVRPKQKCID